MVKQELLKKVTIGSLIIGIVCLVGTFFVPPFLEQTTIISGWPVSFNDNSAVNVNQSYVAVFTLNPGQKCNMRISNIYDTNESEDIDVYFAFITYSYYLDRYENDADPDTLTSLYFMETFYQYPLAADSDALNTLDHLDSDDKIDESQSFSYTFMGGGDSSNIWSIPGTYALLVWSDNSGPGEYSSFGLEIKVDGQGDLIRTILTWIGLIALAAGVIIGIAYIIIMRKR